MVALVQGSSRIKIGEDSSNYNFFFYHRPCWVKWYLTLSQGLEVFHGLPSSSPKGGRLGMVCPPPSPFKNSLWPLCPFCNLTISLWSSIFHNFVSPSYSIFSLKDLTFIYLLFSRWPNFWTKKKKKCRPSLFYWVYTCKWSFTLNNE